MDEARIGDKNYGDRFRTKSKKKQKKIKKKKVDLTRLDLGDLSKQKGDVFRREEEYLDRFVTFLDMGGTRNYVKGNQILEETIKKQKDCLQQLSDLNLEAISPKDEETPKTVKYMEMSSHDVEEKQDIPASSIKLLSGVGSCTETAHDLRFDLNPYNKWNHQFVTGKVLTRKDAESGFGAPNTKFLASTLDKARPAIERSDLPKTSSQEIGWFTKTYRPVRPSTADSKDIGSPEDRADGNKKLEYKGITTFGLNPLVNHPKRMTDISRYKDTYWSYYPPPIAKFHPKENR